MERTVEARSSTANFHIKQTADTAVQVEELKQNYSVVHYSGDSKLALLSTMPSFYSSLLEVLVV